MKHIRLSALVALSALMTTFSLSAAETGMVSDWLKISNTLMFEYDDNIYELGEDEMDSYKVLDTLSLGAALDLEQTKLTLRYSPTFIWWDDREPDDTDLHHSADFTLGHEFSPRVNLSVKDLFRLQEQPEEEMRGVFVRDNDDYLYNEIGGSLDMLALQRTYVVLGARHTLIDYDNEATSLDQDRDIIALGVTVRHVISPSANLMVDYRNETIGYDFQETSDLRDSVSDFIGLGYEKTGGSFVGLFRAGAQFQNYENEDLDDRSEPYGDVTLTYVFSPRTRLALSAAYSMLESEQVNFASQDRTILAASFTHDLSAKIGISLAGSYRMSKYEADYRVVEDERPSAGDEDIIMANAKVAYRLDVRNSVELSYNLTDLSSDLQPEFERSRVSLGWRLDL